MTAPAEDPEPQTSSSLTSRLADHIAATRWEDLPTEVRERAALLVTDTLASITAGQVLDSTQALAHALEAAGTLRGNHRIPGRAEKVSGYAAAYLAGAAAHGFDFDDTHARAQIHPGAPVIAAALAAAQTAKADAHTLLTAVVAGYEAMARISYGLNPDAHARSGFHLTATTGVFGAAAAAAVIHGLRGEELEQAWGTCLSMAAGSGQFLVNGAWTKRIHVGLAAANGFLAVQLAAAGVTGAADAISGRDGFYNLYSPAPTPAEALRGLGEDWEILRSAVKPYPCCRAIHAPLDAALELRAAHGFTADEIVAIHVGVPERCHQITCQPMQSNRNPQNVVDCQFSLHLCLAQALVAGSLSFSDYPNALTDREVKRLMDLIETSVDPEADAVYPRFFPGRVSIQLASGQRLDRYIEIPLGEPEKMLDRTELRQKFTSLVGTALPRSTAVELFDTAFRLADPDASLERLLSLGERINPEHRAIGIGTNRMDVRATASSTSAMSERKATQ